jgi:hypothetical protein
MRIKISGTVDSGSINVINGTNIGLYVVLGAVYSITDLNANPDGSVFYAFKVVTIDNINKLFIEWLDNKPVSPTLPSLGYSFTEIRLGYGKRDDTEALESYYHRSGYIAIDNIIFAIFKNQFSKWNWFDEAPDSDWIEKPVVNPYDRIPFYFRYKRPLVRPEMVEKTIGGKDAPQKNTHPYVVFYPTMVIDRFQDWPWIEPLLQNLPIPAKYVVANDEEDSPDVIEYGTVQVKEFVYQITAVCDNWKDLRIIQTYIQNNLFPLYYGERLIEFPSGFKRKFEIDDGQSISDDEKGIHEISFDFHILIPLIHGAPALTYSILSGELQINEDDAVEIDFESE